MNNRNTTLKNVSVNKLINLFNSSPSEAYQALIESRFHIHFKHAPKFWEAYKQLDLPALLAKFPDSAEVWNKTGKLHLFWDLFKMYRAYIEEYEKKILALNPDPQFLIKALFLSLELGDSHTSNESMPKYSFASLEAISGIYKKLFPKLNSENKTGYSLELFNHSKFLLCLNIDLNLLNEFIDMYEWSGFALEQNKNGKGYTLSLPPQSKKEKNLFLLNELKAQIKRDYKRSESQEKISDQEHFKRIDQIYKTNEGLATVFHSSGVKTISQTPGLTSMQVDDEYFSKATSSDPKESGEAMVKLIHLMLTQSFHYNLRHALSNIYQPNDEIDIHALQIQVKENQYASLYEIFCVVSCIIGIADGIRYIRQFPYGGGIASVKQDIIRNLQTQNPEKELEKLAHDADVIIVNHLPEIEKVCQPFDILTSEAIMKYLKRIEELKQKTDNELLNLVDMIFSLENKIPFSPLFKINGEYFFSFRSCYQVDLNRMVYDYFVTNKLYSSTRAIKGSEEAKGAGENQQSRESKFNLAIKNILLNLTPYSECGLIFPDESGEFDFGDLKGDIDAIAYFKEENIFIPIQVKLSNTSLYSEKGKSVWVESNIKRKALHQVYKDTKLLSLKSGQEFIGKKLKIENTSRLSDALIYPLIVTDNFYVDHEQFIYTEKDERVMCVSYFELKHLILNLNVSGKQDKWELSKENKPGNNLISLLESNIFWKFLNETVSKTKMSKSLTVIDEVNRVHLVV